MADRLDQGAREYFTWPVTAKDLDGNAINLISANITFATSSGNVTKTAPIVNGRFQVLISGPMAPANPDAVVLPLGRTSYKIIYTDVVERLVSNEGIIVVT
jgi:hypothetical protein